MNKNPAFKTERGLQFPGVTAEEFPQLIEKLREPYGISAVQICEAASYSAAMVARVALGLSAEGARVAALIRDNLFGWVTLATLRHLSNAGTACEIIVLTDTEENYGSPDIQHQLKPIHAAGIPTYEMTSADIEQQIERINSCHALISGLHSSQDAPERFSAIVDALNELQTPIHCIQAPLGIDTTSGERSKTPLFAATTLSLGMPLCGLQNGSEYAGRHYICDISITGKLYQEYGVDLTPLFSEQPVVQIFPVQNEAP